MEISTQIKKYRNEMKLSQEELAEKVYVTRQTISNWENGKSYPDIHSLILLGSLFHISLEQLIKGDIEIMKKEIKSAEIAGLNRYATIYSIFLAATIISAVPLALWLGAYAFIPWGLIFAVTMFFAYKTEKVKKENNVQTYKEIVAFLDGKRLDEIETQQEAGKRPYQKTFLALGSAFAALVISLILIWIFK